MSRPRDSPKRGGDHKPNKSGDRESLLGRRRSVILLPTLKGGGEHATASISKVRAFKALRINMMMKISPIPKTKNRAKSAIDIVT